MPDWHFDVVFIDCSASKPYDRKSIENRPLGGVESSVIRVAEGLGSLGISVAVVKASDPSNQIHHQAFEPIMGQYAFFMHEKELPRMACRYLVCLRGPLYLNSLSDFTKQIKTQKFVWCHDLATPACEAWVPELRKHDATVVAVSQWHKTNIQCNMVYDKITYIHNPLDPEIYLLPGQKRDNINRDLMVWAASPHKGLSYALGVFKKVHERLPNLRLLIYNPGYIKGDVLINPGILYYGPTTVKNVWHNVKKALCYFYPTDFQETFGLAPAEANALGTPVLGYEHGALPEVISDKRQLVPFQREDELIERVVKWYNDGPPEVYGNPRFTTANVIRQWLALFGRAWK